MPLEVFTEGASYVGQSLYDKSKRQTGSYLSLKQAILIRAGFQ